MIFPSPPTGSDPQASWLGRLLDVVKRQKILPGRGYRVREYPSGTILEIEDRSGGGKSVAQNMALYKFVVHGLYGPPDMTDFVIATPLDGGATVQILKPPLLRFSLAAHGGITYSAWDPVGQTRVATGLGIAVTQTITPQYLTNDILYAQTLGGVIYDLNVDNRTFAAP